MSGICETTASILVVEAADVEHLALGEADRRGSLDDVVDFPDVVVPAVQDAGDIAAAQLAVGHVQPPVKTAGHLLGEPAVDRAVRLVERVKLVG
jgi:hypothetical protein